MPDIITMPEAIYRVAAMRFNPMFVNLESPGTPFNPSARITGSSAVFWQVEFSLTPMAGGNTSNDELASLRRFLMKLRGGRVLTRLYDPSRLSPRGAGGTSTTVNVKTAGVAGAESITLKNLLPSEATVFKAGDFFGLGENLHMIEDNASSDSNGEATVYFNPPARKSFAAGDAVQLLKPTGLFRLTAGDTALMISPPIVSDALTLSFTEEPSFD